ncbi:hypothetical protein ACFQ5F_09525 [Kroppenstedtia eburnea]|uniref:Uncharacterized protein n=1 Tax=Kroppenstedtia eburnea TaxID=714067 RepID=A0A1N7MI54_9BACL|nr:hypothetical protein [Kroppenstedtia eburnea]EGK07116.1 hypothetical protein HMPREF9374_3877 [Desmospora sp. 8437]QKI81588.1 hypothetical protein GXN75_06015 [Kroppenstedtia eburnea]SIS85815.1 hypothetical protein SAMN05421790_106113 [Kroppenstedtia eburnea]
MERDLTELVIAVFFLLGGLVILVLGIIRKNLNRRALFIGGGVFLLLLSFTGMSQALGGKQPKEVAKQEKPPEKEQAKKEKPKEAAKKEEPKTFEGKVEYAIHKAVGDKANTGKNKSSNSAHTRVSRQS